MIKYVDFHCHLPFPHFDTDRAEILADMEYYGIAAVVVGVDRDSSRAAREFAESHENIWATAGLHPADNKRESFDPEYYKTLIASKKVRMVGECGLDYHHGKDERERARQRDEFAKQIAFATEHDLPLMLHVRDAHRDALHMLKAASGSVRGNAHFFTGSLEEARAYWNMGFSTSFPGVITFTNDCDEVVKEAPNDLILIETDSPYAAPKPHRGKRNDPRSIPIIFSRMAAIRGVEEAALGPQLLENARRILGIAEEEFPVVS